MNANSHRTRRNQTIFPSSLGLVTQSFMGENQDGRTIIKVYRKEPDYFSFQPRSGNTEFYGRKSRWPHHNKGLQEGADTT